MTDSGRTRTCIAVHCGQHACVCEDYKACHKYLREFGFQFQFQFQNLGWFVSEAELTRIQPKLQAHALSLLSY